MTIARSSREWIIVNALETFGPMSLRELGRKTNFDHTTLYGDLGRLTEAKVLVREEVQYFTSAKHPRYSWRLA